MGESGAATPAAVMGCAATAVGASSARAQQSLESWTSSIAISLVRDASRTPWNDTCTSRGVGTDNSNV